MNFVGRQVLRLKTRKALQANSAMETKGQHRFCCSSTQALEEMNIAELQTDPWSNNPPEAMDLLVCKAENQLPIKNVEAGRLVQHVSDCSLHRGQRSGWPLFPPPSEAHSASRPLDQYLSLTK